VYGNSVLYLFVAASYICQIAMSVLVAPEFQRWNTCIYLYGVYYIYII